MNLLIFCMKCREIKVVLVSACKLMKHSYVLLIPIWRHIQAKLIEEKRIMMRLYGACSLCMAFHGDLLMSTSEYHKFELLNKDELEFFAHKTTTKKEHSLFMHTVAILA